MSDTQTLTAARTPTVYFIDDSATMREVIKIAFRKENIHVITCADAASALAQFGDSAPDAVITDVIMPDKDGYEVCQFIKEHERFGKTPVILMSGVVNRTVAEKAMQVKADELVRKPFQPQDLIARVKSLLNPGSPAQRGSLREEETNSSQAASRVLGGLFAPPAALQPGTSAEFRASQSGRHVRMAGGNRANIRAPAYRTGNRASGSADSAIATRRCGATISRSSKIAPRNPSSRAAGKKTPSRTGSPKTVLRRPRSRLQIHAGNRLTPPRFRICFRCTLLFHEISATLPFDSHRRHRRTQPVLALSLCSVEYRALDRRDPDGSLVHPVFRCPRAIGLLVFRERPSPMPRDDRALLAHSQSHLPFWRAADRRSVFISRAAPVFVDFLGPHTVATRAYAPGSKSPGRKIRRRLSPIQEKHLVLSVGASPALCSCLCL